MVLLSSLLQRDFYQRNTLEVARQLLGARLVRLINHQRIAGIITETEAYRGEEDLGCHARAGKTARTQVMYGPPGHAYVYFTYGMHWCLNCVTEEEGFPAAVLIRSVLPREGIDFIARRRAPQPRTLWTNGPAKICQAFDIDRELNDVDLCTVDNGLWIERGETIPDHLVTTSARIGLFSTPEPWKSIPWRFVAKLPEDKTRKY
jgi:DNA-3-methyladenine glycosylase